MVLGVGRPIGIKGGGGGRTTGVAGRWGRSNLVFQKANWAGLRQGNPAKLDVKAQHFEGTPKSGREKNSKKTGGTARWE